MPPPCDALKDHDYTRPAAGNLQDVLRKMRELATEIQQLTHEKVQPLVYKFCITDEDIYYYTRFPSKEVFTLFWRSIHPSASEMAYWPKAQWTVHESAPPEQQIAPIDEFFMFLCRIGPGIEEKTLSAIFEVSLSTVTHTILTWTSYLYQVLSLLPTWLSKQCIQATMPEKVKVCFPELRVIIDCTEISCETTSFSKCEKKSSFKGLIGIAPCGLITFISSLYTNSASDQAVTKRSKLLHLLQPGDGVMADERFVNKKMAEDVGATLILPSLNTPQQNSKDTQKTQVVSCLRSLAERVKLRVKEYHIWDNPVPLYMTGSVNQLWVVCCLLSNYQGPLDIKGHISLTEHYCHSCQHS
ncbi:uncharacterized protein LOC113130727 [Mastacembelus armatus]|uniref:Uncharacterized LOC113130727 n=1 Tax=Mastacembelus armatus TaxID=205130 RepID=A0A7N8YID3_9TELE|nr:uncharacterized protein LOC113130727 [Mastacembelus armatus]